MTGSIKLQIILKKAPLSRLACLGDRDQPFPSIVRKHINMIEIHPKIMFLDEPFAFYRIWWETPDELETLRYIDFNCGSVLFHFCVHWTVFVIVPMRLNMCVYTNKHIWQKVHTYTCKTFLSLPKSREFFPMHYFRSIRLDLDTDVCKIH